MTVLFIVLGYALMPVGTHMGMEKHAITLIVVNATIVGQLLLPFALLLILVAPSRRVHLFVGVIVLSLVLWLSGLPVPLYW